MGGHLPATYIGAFEVRMHQRRASSLTNIGYGTNVRLGQLTQVMEVRDEPTTITWGKRLWSGYLAQPPCMRAVTVEEEGRHKQSRRHEQS